MHDFCIPIHFSAHSIERMMQRDIHLSKGEITIDNQPINSITLESLRDKISLVSQETTLFDDTILNNIKYANENATSDEIYEVAKLSNAHEFINKLPNK